MVNYLPAVGGDPDFEDDDPARGITEGDGEQLDDIGLPLPIYYIDQRCERPNDHVV